jgi:hypothetical protein
MHTNSSLSTLHGMIKCETGADVYYTEYADTNVTELAYSAVY